MRLWSIHPCYLDPKGLVALWREGLLAQKVLQGATRGYKNHPQLMRFRKNKTPVGAIADYLRAVADEADKRGYRFDKSKIVSDDSPGKMAVTSGQLQYEFAHLLQKIEKRAPELHIQLKNIGKIEPHPKFEKVVGGVEDWEVVKEAPASGRNKTK